MKYNLQFNERSWLVENSHNAGGNWSHEDIYSTQSRARVANVQRAEELSCLTRGLERGPESTKQFSTNT